MPSPHRRGSKPTRIIPVFSTSTPSHILGGWREQHQSRNRVRSLGAPQRSSGTVPLSTSPSLGGDVCPVLRDGGDHPRVGLPGVVVHQRELVAVHQQRQYHLKRTCRTVVGCGRVDRATLSRPDIAFLDINTCFFYRSFETWMSRVSSHESSGVELSGGALLTG